MNELVEDKAEWMRESFGMIAKLIDWALNDLEEGDVEHAKTLLREIRNEAMLWV